MLASLGNFLESSSPLSILVATSLLVLATIELGFRIGVGRSRSTKVESDALLGAMTGAHLALLAFIMAFSFSQAANHYSNRNELVLNEADAIAEGYRHAGLLGEEQKFIFQELIHRYLAVRLTITDREDFQPVQMIADSEKLLSELWEMCEQISRNQTADGSAHLIVQSVDDLYQLHERRKAAAFYRLPAIIWIILYVLLILSMLGIGHFSGLKGRRNPVSSTLLALSFSIVLYLVSDLDRPMTGMVIVDYSPMINISNRLESDRQNNRMDH